MLGVSEGRGSCQAPPGCRQPCLCHCHSGEHSPTAPHVPPSPFGEPQPATLILALTARLASGEDVCRADTGSHSQWQSPNDSKPLVRSAQGNGVRTRPGAASQLMGAGRALAGGAQCWPRSTGRMAAGGEGTASTHSCPRCVQSPFRAFPRPWRTGICPKPGKKCCTLKTLSDPPNPPRKSRAPATSKHQG